MQRAKRVGILPCIKVIFRESLLTIDRQCKSQKQGAVPKPYDHQIVHNHIRRLLAARTAAPLGQPSERPLEPDLVYPLAKQWHREALAVTGGNCLLLMA